MGIPVILLAVLWTLILALATCRHLLRRTRRSSTGDRAAIVRYHRDRDRLGAVVALSPRPVPAAVPTVQPTDYEYVVKSFNQTTAAAVGGISGLGFGLIESAAHAELPTVLPGTGTVPAPTSGTVELNVSVTLSNPSAAPVTVPWTPSTSPAHPQAPTASKHRHRTGPSGPS